MLKRTLKIVVRTILDQFTPHPLHPSMGGDSTGLQLRWRYGWLKGWLWRPWWGFRAAFGGTRLSIGKRFSLQGRLILRGPGAVLIGDDVIIDGITTPYTHSSEAVIRIGDRTFLNGTRFGSSIRIEIGHDCILADARLMDTDFHAVHKNRIQFGATPLVAPIRIGNNVWIAAGAAVLKGVSIGDDTVIAFGSVVISDIHSGKIAGGNPAKIIRDLPNS